VGINMDTTPNLGEQVALEVANYLRLRPCPHLTTQPLGGIMLCDLCLETALRSVLNPAQLNRPGRLAVMVLTEALRTRRTGGGTNI
jgi:hypothetical protein